MRQLTLEKMKERGKNILPTHVQAKKKIKKKTKNMQRGVIQMGNSY